MRLYPSRVLRMGSASPDFGLSDSGVVTTRLCARRVTTLSDVV